jgi:acyl-CoA thioester hydrolase
MTHESGWHSCQIRVRYAETDQMGVVYHANYLTWFEIGRTEYIRDKGMPYKDAEALGLLMPVIDVHIRYLMPARYDDLVEVRTRIANVGPLRTSFEYVICRADQAGDILVTGSSEHVWVDGNWKPVRINKVAPELYQLLLDSAKGASGGS